MSTHLEMRCCRRWLSTAVLVMLFTALLIGLRPASSAAAAFPGTNGLIAFQSERDGNTEIYVMNADGSGQMNLTNNPAIDGTAARPFGA